MFCRNAYANYYQYIGQKVFLQHLKANASREHVVFMDMDVLVLDSIVEVFCSDYGYGLTINANDYDPVDIGLQFVQSSFYDEAIGFLQVLTASTPWASKIVGCITTNGPLPLISEHTFEYIRLLFSLSPL